MMTGGTIHFRKPPDVENIGVMTLNSKHNTQKHKKHRVDECDLQRSAIESIQMLKFESATAENT